MTSRKSERNAGDKRVLDIGPPARKEDETFEEYKIRRARQNDSIDMYLKGFKAIDEDVN